MRLKLDENLPDVVAVVLRELGHDVELARDEGLAGAADSLVLGQAVSEGRALVTLDVDFADVVRHDPRPTAGIVVLRPHRTLVTLIVAVARSIGELLTAEEVHGHLWVADESRVRVWPGWRPA